jgi:hypothetical protein
LVEIETGDLISDKFDKLGEPLSKGLLLKELFLHVGFHKTGTTALQYELSSNRKNLLEQGFIYPKTRRFRAHHEFAWSIADRGWGWKEKGGEKAGPKPAKRMFRFLERSDKNAVVSSEFLSELTQQQIRGLVARIGQRNLRVIFTLRPISKILPSAYQQEVKNGSTKTYSVWLKRVFDSEKDNRNKTRLWNRHNHHVEIQKWAEIVGKDNITVIVLDDGHPSFLTDSFFDLLGIDKGSLKASEKLVINRSMDTAEMELLRQININFDRELGWNEYVANIRSTLVKGWTHSPPSPLSSGKLENPIEYKSQIESKAQEIVSGIETLGVQVIGDLNFLKLVSFGDSLPPTHIAIDDLIQPILNRTRKTVLDSYPNWRLIRFVLGSMLREWNKSRKQFFTSKNSSI